MTTRDAIRKLLAYGAGKPLPRGTTLHLPRRPASETLVLAFVRMGGESRPWGVAIGPPHSRPKIYTVAEGRDRESVGEMLQQIAPTLLSHMGHPSYAPKGHRTSLPNVWLPNATHVEMLHFIAFTYTFAKRGEARRMKVLNALGRAANWLFQESTRPGQLSCIDASAALREAFVFPAEDVRQAHTGYLLAWLEAKGSFDKRLHAAAEAEYLAVSTSLDPQVEKAGLDKIVEAFNAAKRNGNRAAMDAAARRIRQVLEPELRHRFEVTVRAYRFLANEGRRPNRGLPHLEEFARERHSDYRDVELRLSAGQNAWVKSPETDRHSLVAASQYVTVEADRDRYVNALVHDDPDLQGDLLAAGDGIRGRIIKIESESQGRRTRALWTIEQDGEWPLTNQGRGYGSSGRLSEAES